jgi:hypothetical protein
MRGDREKLLHMEDALSKRVVGQDPAIKVSGYMIEKDYGTGGLIQSLSLGRVRCCQVIKCDDYCTLCQYMLTVTNPQPQ